MPERLLGDYALRLGQIVCRSKENKVLFIVVSQYDQSLPDTPKRLGYRHRYMLIGLNAPYGLTHGIEEQILDCTPGEPRFLTVEQAATHPSFHVRDIAVKLYEAQT